MNFHEVLTAIDEANEDDLIEIFVFRKPVQFCKLNYDFDVSTESKTLSLVSKNGRVVKVINLNSIKIIRIQSPINHLMDPYSNKYKK